jgi:hypothetical protein
MDDIVAGTYADAWFDGYSHRNVIINPRTADATPIITVVGSGDIDLAIGSRSIHIDGLAIRRHH